MSEGESFGEQHQNPEKSENFVERYSAFLRSYHRASQRIKATQRLYPIPGDPEISAELSELDKKRHETHLQLLEMGSRLGKDEGNVLVDIIRQQRTLEEYGLPEFSILKEDDIVETGDDYPYYYFNVDSHASLPSQGDSIPWARDEGINRISKDKFMLVFAIVPIVNYGEEQLPDDYQVRVKRAEMLAQEVGGEIFEQRDSEHHDGSAKILGLILPKKDLEEIAGIIRNNPEKFRLAEEFYSEQERAMIVEARPELYEE